MSNCWRLCDITVILTLQQIFRNQLYIIHQQYKEYGQLYIRKLLWPAVVRPRVLDNQLKLPYRCPLQAASTVD